MPAEDLLSICIGCMQLFMWQPDTVGVAHYVMVCFLPSWGST